jgi:molecular chaperone HtpG
MVEQVKEKMDFHAEIKQLLHLMIHSLYSNKEIFIRELISNASDAADKLRFEAIAHPEYFENDSELKIQLTIDKKNRTITIADNGIGMNRDEIISNLGTIARSGTKDFFSKLTGDQQKDAALIGQFGVGFYSAFIVAETITVESRRAGDPSSSAVRWESTGAGDFTVESIDKAKRGTSITLHLRAEEDDFLSQWKLKSTIQKYSDHISIPIEMQKEEWDKDKNEQVTLPDFEAINSAQALWSRSKSNITPEEYQSFYKNISHDSADPLCYSHSRVEGRTEFTQLLFIPTKAPFDLWDRSKHGGIKLYVKRVFIMDDAEQLMPTYLRFIKGIIDSTDLPLNVSREILQESKDVKTIRESSTKRVLSMLEELANNESETERAKFASFWTEFGQVLKEGVGEDFSNKDKLVDLLRFASTHIDSDEQSVSLKQYKERIKEKQDKIYYITGESYQAAKNSPHLEIFHKKGIEVLILSDRVDEWMLSFLQDYDGTPLVSVAKGDLDADQFADEKEKESQSKTAEEFKDLVEKTKSALGEQVKDVRVTFRLVDSPACLVADENEMSANLLRMLKAAGQNAPESKPILEINPHHPLIEFLKKQESEFNDWALLIYDQALIAEGGQLKDPANFVKRSNQLLLGLMNKGT